MEYLNIGSVRIEKTAALAPMASVADRAYRMICREHGAAYAVSEMISAKGLCFSDRKTEELCTVDEREHPYALQLFGDDPYYCAEAAKRLADFGPDIIDINMGCPVPKIAGNGSGSALMRDVPRAAQIASAVVKAVDLPVTCKIRAGWDADSINAPEMAHVLEDAGIAAVAVHGRTRMQMYHGDSDPDVIRRVKQAVKIPVIGNGDVTSPAGAKRMYDVTGCDLVMIGRGSYGDPWIFERIRHFLATGEELAPPSIDERLSEMIRQTEMAVSFKGERLAMAEARRLCSFYIRGIKNAAKYRGRCGMLKTLDDVRTLADEIRNDTQI
ncbi:MAG: tRNA dihydrouridine synthase DusB [Oscillospiraceae bacterium]|nr:tRNA dihydrouridine synthase DusB [Oscillospiraceae bacterium]